MDKLLALTIRPVLNGYVVTTAAGDLVFETKAELVAYFQQSLDALEQA